MDREKIRQIVEEVYQPAYETSLLFKTFVDCLLDEEMFDEADEEAVLYIARDIAIVHEFLLEKELEKVNNQNQI